MAQKYMLVPLPRGIFARYDLTTRAVIGALYDRTRLSGYNQIGDPSGRAWYDHERDCVYCVYAQDELAAQLGVSDRTIRRSLDTLRRDGLVDWRKATYKGANRYYLHQGITDELQKQ